MKCVHTTNSVPIFSILELGRIDSIDMNWVCGVTSQYCRFRSVRLDASCEVITLPPLNVMVLYISHGCRDIRHVVAICRVAMGSCATVSGCVDVAENSRVRTITSA